MSTTANTTTQGTGGSGLPFSSDLELLRKRFSMVDLTHPALATLFNIALERLPKEGAGAKAHHIIGMEIDPNILSPLDPVNIVQMEVKLPPLPTVLSELQVVTSKEDSSAIEVGEVIAKDPSLTAWVLKLVNSPFFGFSVKVDTVTRAVSLLGMQQIKTFAIGGMLNNLTVRLPKEVLDLDEFWRHSVATALAAQAIWKILGRQEPERLFVAGLLHDCGMLALGYAAPSMYKALTYAVKQSGKPCYVAEQELISFDHARLGGMLLHRWNMPLSLVMAVLRHHQVEAPERYTEAAVVHVADIIATAITGRTADAIVPPLDTAVWQILGLSTANVAFVVNSMMEKLSDMYSMLRGQ